MKKLRYLYSEKHGKAEISVIYDEISESTYSVYFNNGINIIFNTLDDLFKFNIMGDKIKRGYISESDFEKLFTRIDKPFEQYFEWLE